MENIKGTGGGEKTIKTCAHLQNTYAELQMSLSLKNNIRI